jgi:hypothetical protein
MQHPLWRDDGSVVYNFCWLSPAQSFSGPIPAGLMIIFYSLRFEIPNVGGQVPVFISPRNKVAQLYLQALRYLLVASYDSEGDGGNIPAYNISAWTTQKTPFLCCCFQCCVRVCLDAHVIATEPLHSNSHCLETDDTDHIKNDNNF